MGRFPSELGRELCWIDCVATVVAGALLDELEDVGGFSHLREDQADRAGVVEFAVGADQIGLPDPPVFDDAHQGDVVVRIEHTCETGPRM